MTLFKRILCLLALLALVPFASPAPLLAQDAATQEAAAEEEGPSFPADLADTGISLDELKLRVIPLKVDQLTALADAWLDIVQEQTQSVIDTQVAILKSSDEEAEEIQRKQLATISEQRGVAFSLYSTVIDNLEKKGGDATLVETYRAYRSSIIVDEKQNADWQTLMSLAIDWATSRDGGIALALKLGTVVGAFIVLVIISRTVRAFARRAFSRVPNLSKLLQAFLSMVVYWLTIAFGLMIVLSALGIDITPVFALVGGLSFIIAFAFQDTLSNLAAGLMIMFNRPFDEGDYVSIAGMGGTVKSVSVVSSTITTPDNQVIVIPNSKVWGDVITNVTASTTRRVDLVFGIGYDDSIADAHAILERVVADHDMVLSDPAPVIRVNELGASSVDFICRPWVKSSDYWAVYWDLTRQVKEAFDAEGISIPFPQTDMHLHMATEGAAVPFIGAAAIAGDDGLGRPEGAPDFRTGDEGVDMSEEAPARDDT